MAYTQVTPISKEKQPDGSFIFRFAFSGPGFPLTDASPRAALSINRGTTLASIGKFCLAKIMDLNDVQAVNDFPQIVVNQTFNVASFADPAPTAAEAAANDWATSIANLEDLQRKLARLTALGITASGQLAADIASLTSLIATQQSTIDNEYNSAPDNATRAAMRTKL